MDACFCFSCVCFSLSVLSQEIGWEECLRNDLFVCRVGLFIVHSCFVLLVILPRHLILLLWTSSLVGCWHQAAGAVRVLCSCLAVCQYVRSFVIAGRGPACSGPQR